MNVKNLETPSVQGKVSEAEWRVRVDLAASYRLSALFGWDDLVYTHISARVPDTEDQFLINPFGLGFDEITASSLVKIDINGDKVMDNPYPVNKAGFIIHGAIHEARHDAACIVHLHTDYGIAVSALEEGLIPLSQSSIFPHASLAYHDYEGLAVREGEKKRLVADLGDKLNLILRNHGTLTLGASVASAFENMYFLEKACKTQILAMSTGRPLRQVDEESYRVSVESINQIRKDFSDKMGPWPALLRRLNRLDDSYQL